MQAFVPKSRKPKFELVLKILDLNNVPLVTGSSYVKWHLPHSAAAEHRGKTTRAPIKEHKVTWDYEKALQLRVTADKNGLLQSTDIDFEIIQEYHSGPKAERITLGTIKLNLAEYVDTTYEREEEIVRRYLMQESKINSTVKIGILMRQLEGERNFTAPPLKTGPIFGGIAGIMSQEQAEPDDIGHLPAMPTKFSRDLGEHQDVYRKTLAAAWSSQELPADECIEDIFAGGDGWGRLRDTPMPTRDPYTDDENETNVTDFLQVPGKGKNAQRNRSSDARQRSRRDKNVNADKNQSNGSDSGSATPTPSSSSDGRLKRVRRPQNEVSELELREDLRSWAIRVPPD